MGLKKTLTETKYRISVRNALSNATDEEIRITKEECIREQNRRWKKTSK